MQSIVFQPIGLIHSPYKQTEGMPIQPAGAAGVRGVVEVFPNYTQGLQDLVGFSHIFLLYHFHQSEGYNLIVTPFLDSKAHGVFATRAPRRPNPLGLSLVRLLRQENNLLYIENVDILDGTPLLDIKPYVGEFDHPGDRISDERAAEKRFGWVEQAKGEVQNRRADNRFDGDRGPLG